MAVALSPPLVVPPVTRCVSGVRVQGQFEGARVTVLASGRPVGSARASGPDFVVPITPGVLHAGDQLTAMQTLDGVDSDPSPDPVTVMTAPTKPEDLAQPFTRLPLVECADCLWIEGILPGATVTAAIGSRPPVTTPVAVRPAVHIDVDGGLGAGETITLSQSACGLVGPPVTLPAALGQARDTWPASPPIIQEPLYPCQTTILLTGLRLGATVVIIRGRDEFSACFGADRGLFTFGEGLHAGEPLVVRQDYPSRRCGLRGTAGEVRVSSSPPPPPWFPYPVCAGDHVVTVEGLVPGATVVILADGNPLCRASAAEETVSIALPAAGLGGAGTIGVKQALCIGGPWSPIGAREIRPLGSARRPRIVEPLFECGRAVGVLGLDAGTSIRVMSAAQGEIGRALANGDERVDVTLWSCLAALDRISLQTLRCGVYRDWPDQIGVAPFRRDFTPPWLPDPALDFGGSVLVKDVVPGASVTVERVASQGTPPQVAGVVIGHAFATTRAASVPVPVLPPGTFLRARQAMCSQQPPPSGIVKLGEAGVPAYVDGSAFRICQLTGASDAADRPHPFDTETVDLYGTDLGIPVEQGGRLWLFFGDTIGARDVDLDSDPIAWTVVSDLGPDGHEVPWLNWLVDDNGHVQRLVVDGLPELANLEVPTGGFAYDGALYLFVATNKIDGTMRTSHLARAVGGIPGQVPQLLYSALSSTVPTATGYEATPAGPWLIQVSPTVVRNADWPGLPATKGDGVLAFGTGPYWDSDIHLAWFPITPGQVPPPPAEWKYLVDPAPTGPGSWRTAGELLGVNPLQPGLPPGQPRGLLGVSGLGELSVAWIPSLRRWVTAFPSNERVEGAPAGSDVKRAVVCRVARAPWGPWVPWDPAAEKLVIFHPHDPKRDAGNFTGKRFVGGHARQERSRECVVYSPYIIGRWCRWDASVRRLRLVYTLSTELNDEGWTPVGYQPQLMEARLQFP